MGLLNRYSTFDGALGVVLDQGEVFWFVVKD